MRKILYCLVVLFLFGVHCEEINDGEDLEYDDFYDYGFLEEEEDKLTELLKSTINVPVTTQDSDKIVEQDIQKFREENENDSKEHFASLEDYQVEDNRQKSLEDKKTEATESVEEIQENNSTNVLNVPEINNSESEETSEDRNLLPEVDSTETDFISKETPEGISQDYASIWGDSNSTAQLVPIVEDDKKIFDETHELLNGDSEESFDDEKIDANLSTEKQKLEELIEETKRLLSDTDNGFDELKESTENGDESDENAGSTEINDDDTVAKAAEDLQEDLQKLFDTFDKLKDDSVEDKDSLEEVEATNVLEYEKKYGKPFGEDAVLSARADEDYEQISDSNLSEIFSTVEESGEELNSNEAAEDTSNESIETTIGSKSSELMTESDGTEETIMYVNDALTDEDNKEDENNVEEFDVKETTPEVRKKMVDDLTSEELDDLMTQFKIYHSEDLDVHSEDFAKNVEPISMKISADETLIVRSPNYPSPYPTDSIVDWMFEGEGTGIELNITDFAVNGALGDYLLVKPGGTDETGHEGLVFSYRLTSPRMYRFTDVNKMFVRFQANQGMMFMRGFELSIRMIWPPQVDEEEEPETDAVIAPPASTLTLHLGGVTPQEFREKSEQFRELIADMATTYISKNNIDPGMNATIEITQIISSTVCNINWPGHEDCAQVTFGVPLNYEEDLEYRLDAEDLEDMWRTSINKEPFAQRLRELGITEFAMPDDSSVMMMWLVIGAGVVLSMAMLAFALWKFSCSEDYARMPAFSDTDSIRNEKRGLDLYPTPHQILPPLYAENDFKWNDDSTRVDMGGFGNKSFVRDDIYDFDSEDDIPKRDRFTSDV